MSLFAKVITLFLRLCQRRLLQATNPHVVWRVGAFMTRLLHTLSKPPAQCTHHAIQVQHIPVEVIENHRPVANDRLVLLYLHGGGFAFGSARDFRHFVGRLCQRAGIATAWVPDYTLMDQSPFPAGLNDVVAVWKALLEQHAPEDLVLAGDSAGGNLSMALCHALIEQGLPLPSRVFLSSPWLDPSLAMSDTRPEVVDAFLGADEIKARAWLKRMFADPYVGNVDRQQNKVSPLLGSLQSFPPVYVQCGARELFMVDSLQLVQKARSAGHECHVDVWLDMFHDFLLFAPRLPEGRSALKAAASWLGQGTIQRPPEYLHRIRQLSSLPTVHP
ncbi:MAG TPA: alpha/beta hydrolase [Limnobacter sp.]|uniref:alpha/beta hydrolase n=1 Tax=Limnobacter sp. TaxID=2003368 RepID=UPI002EDB2D37